MQPLWNEFWNANCDCIYYFSLHLLFFQVSFKFQVPPACEVSQIIATLVSKLGVKAEEPNGGSDMLLRGWDRLLLLF